ncbi:hypothetical protein [Geomesophilobacter sediminis]|uniref:Uncharacterized protein n=1 Tax=Geomesophilobacter sediminis TaxID=2798584 RepID=A0A8J7S9M3_9BACT|nr:hypothetical protein [Geomesophilobacter sediminis]MBJ6726925.1 hypothetical protein [Geomesophilobacter sediminis]
MNSHHSCRSLRAAAGRVLAWAGGLAAGALLISFPAGAWAAPEVSAESTTILRLGNTDFPGSKDLYPLYEYLHLSLTGAETKGNSLSLYFGGWGRGDLGDKSFNDRYTDGDLQYGFLSYRWGRNNAVANAGRQFVTEGVATQRLDGLYLRSDLGAGFAAAAFVGSPVNTEPNVKADDFVFGGRVTHSAAKYYTLGVSALRSNAGSTRYREEEGVDLWLSPVRQLDVTGRSSYNSVTEGWMEHAYTMSLRPTDKLQLFADLRQVNYRDFFYRVTTTALTFQDRLIDPGERDLALGGGIGFTPVKGVTLTADYRHHDYEIAREAHYYGGKVALSFPEKFAAGGSVHRMDGGSDPLRYLEYRVYASKSFGPADLTLDFIDVNYDSTLSTNNVRNVFVVTAAGAYRVTRSVTLAADVDYSKNPDFDNEVKGMLKAVVSFDAALEGRGKSEK